MGISPSNRNVATGKEIAAHPMARSAHYREHDLLICDHCEAINGLDFIRKFRLTQPQTPIFVASENLDPQFVSDVSEYGVAGFFPKPVRLDNFSRRVKKTLAAAQAMEGKFRPQQTRFPFVRAHPDRLFPLYQFDRSEKAVELGEQICQVANFEPTLFIEGPKGSEFKIMAASILECHSDKALIG